MKMTVATDQSLFHEYDALTQDLSKIFYAQMLGVVNNLDNGSKAELRNSLVETFPEVLSPFMETAAEAGATFYEANRTLAIGGSYSAVPARPNLVKEAVTGLVRFAVSPLGKELGTLLVTTILAGAAQRYISNAGRDSISLNVQRDEQAYGYARKAEPDACAFCALMATNVYDSKQTAISVVGVDRRESGWRKKTNPKWIKVARGNQKIGDDYHDNCRCQPIPVFGTGVDPYEDIIDVNPDAEKFIDAYVAAYEMSSDAARGTRNDAILKNMDQLLKL